MCFWTDGLRKICLDKCLKSPLSEDPLTSNMVNGPKHCWNLNESTFTIFIDHCQGNSVGTSPSEWSAKYYDCFLTCWLPMTSIVFLIETIYSNIFTWNYLRNKKLLRIFLYFGHSDSILNIFKKKMTLIAHVFLNLRTPKNVVR